MNKIAIAIVSVALLLGAARAVTPDPAPSMNAPDQVAWEMFLQVNTATATSAALFETWASDTDTFTTKPVFPASATPLSLHAPVLPTLRREFMLHNKLFVAPGVADGVLEESRRNLPAFKFIVDNGLFARSGLKKRFWKRTVVPARCDRDKSELETNRRDSSIYKQSGEHRRRPKIFSRQ